MKKKLDFKIVPKDEKAWTAIKEASETEIENNRRSTLINQKIIELADEQIKISQELFG
jgi:hypothetical protein